MGELTTEWRAVDARPATERLDGALEWLPLAATIGSVVVALAAMHDLDHPARGAVLLALSVLPLLLTTVSRRVPPVVLYTAAIPFMFVALDGAPILAAAIPALSIVIAVPTTSRGAGIAGAQLAAGCCVVVAFAVSEISWIFVGIGMGAAWAGGWSFRSVMQHMHYFDEEGAAATEEAIRSERRHLAREVHDLVAHALTGSMLSLTEVRLLLDSDREAVLRALDRAESLARESLSDLRRIVRLLSEEGDPRLEPPIELERDITELVDRYRQSGAHVTLAIDGEGTALSVASSWGVYRIVQESLTNAVRHAPGSAVTVRVVRSSDGIRVTVENERGRKERTSSRDSSGRGLRGMWERAALLGGRLEAGPTSTGWMVTSWIPIAPHPAVEPRFVSVDR
jgi:signal transduction histidine kinase